MQLVSTVSTTACGSKSTGILEQDNDRETRGGTNRLERVGHKCQVCWLLTGAARVRPGMTGTACKHLYVCPSPLVSCNPHKGGKPAQPTGCSYLSKSLFRPRKPSPERKRSQRVKPKSRKSNTTEAESEVTELLSLGIRQEAI